MRFLVFWGGFWVWGFEGFAGFVGGWGVDGLPAEADFTEEVRHGWPNAVPLRALRPSGPCSAPVLSAHGGTAPHSPVLLYTYANCSWVSAPHCGGSGPLRLLRWTSRYSRPGRADHSSGSGPVRELLPRYRNLSEVIPMAHVHPRVNGKLKSTYK